MLAGCGGGAVTLENAEKVDLDELGQRFSSARATQLDFEGTLELVVPGSVSPSGARGVIDSQMLYTMGQLNWDDSVGRLDAVKISNIQTSTVAEGTLVRYQVKLPVAWGSKSNLPTSYEFVLPRNMGYAELDAFTEKYKGNCVDYGAHDVTSGIMWYYYRPQRSGCSIADVDVVKATMSATVSTENTTGKYPEYDMVWNDNVLSVVAIFGKYEDGETSESDPGISAYNSFVYDIQSELSQYAPTTVPENIPSSPGVAVPDVTFSATLSGDRKIQVTALLVDNVRSAPPSFDARYSELSANADIIMYNGHAGLGSNVRALARKGRFVQGKYLIVFMNGCDTFAYVDGHLAKTRAAINPDDPTGTKYMEIVTNAMPSYFSSMPGASMALIRGLKNPEKPLTYEQMFRNVDGSQVVVVTGEEDNVFTPGGGGGGEWNGLTEKGAVARGEEKRYATPKLKAGTYVVTLKGNNDADLYVRVGVEPTTAEWDCRPFASTSNETCTMTLEADAPIHLMVRGYSSAPARFSLRAGP